ncbi:MAG: AEC family transporter [Dysgonamonadaceae bacterium]|jgi:predicted permease|nr:AEC family transporter [Dysgonamonadaceae bacterium]
MRAFIFSAQCVLPIFIIIGIGWLLKRKGVMSAAIIDGLNTITFNVALPLMLFRDIAQANFYELFAPGFIAYALLSTLLFFILSWVFAEWFIKDKTAIGAFVQGCFRGNYAIIGLFLISSVLGHSGKGALIVLFAIPLYNILSIVVLSTRSQTPQPFKLGKTLVSIVKNPLILGILCGLPFSIFQLPVTTMPELKFIATTLDYMAMSVNPMALLAIGASISIGKIQAGLSKALVAAAIKLVIGPLVFTLLAYFLRTPLGLSGDDLFVLCMMYAVPTAVASYVMAVKMDNDADLAANIVLITSLLSLFSLTGGIYIFKATGLI